jgi:hypothetical protein
VQPLIEAAKEEAAPPVATGEAKVALAISREVPTASTGPTPAEPASRVPAAVAERSGGEPLPASRYSRRTSAKASRRWSPAASAISPTETSPPRGIFLRAATAGLARGALLLATTYDPRELERLGVLRSSPV